MQCERLLNLAKNWYLSVKDETMAPARMVQFIKDHVATCNICLADADIQGEIEQITAEILPESKIPKAVRLQQEKDEASEEVEVDTAEENSDSNAEEGEEKEEYISDDDLDEDDDLTELD